MNILRLKAACHDVKLTFTRKDERGIGRPSCELNFNPSKDKGFNHNSEKEHPRISETAKFGWVEF